MLKCFQVHNKQLQMPLMLLEPDMKNSISLVVIKASLLIKVVIKVAVRTYLPSNMEIELPINSTNQLTLQVFIKDMDNPRVKVKAFFLHSNTYNLDHTLATFLNKMLDNNLDILMKISMELMVIHIHKGLKVLVTDQTFIQMTGQIY